MLLISENKKDAGKKRNLSRTPSGKSQNNKSEKVMKLVDPDNESISFSNSNVGLVISNIATPKPSSQILYQTNISQEFCSFVTSK